MDIFGIAIMYVGGIWGGVYLIMNEHPYFGLFVLLITASIRYRNVKVKIPPYKEKP